MKIYQPELPFNGKGDHPNRNAGISWHGTTGDWFYVEHRDNPAKCLYADESGTYYFGMKELSFVVPVVWNMRKEAQRVARQHKGRVKKYPYRLMAVK